MTEQPPPPPSKALDTTDTQQPPPSASEPTAKQKPQSGKATLPPGLYVLARKTKILNNKAGGESCVSSSSFCFLTEVQLIYNAGQVRVYTKVIRLSILHPSSVLTRHKNSDHKLH